MATRPVPRPGVLDIEAYVPGKSAAPAGVKLHKLSSNETPLGPSPKAIAAFEGLAAKLELYPDGTSTKLKQAMTLQTAYAVEGTPALGIAGKYYVDPTRSKGFAGMLQIADALIAKEHGGK